MRFIDEYYYLYNNTQKYIYIKYMDEIVKATEISSLNEFLNHKFSVKTLLSIGIIGAFFGTIFIIIIMGGFKNTQDFIKNSLYSRKHDTGKLSQNLRITNANKICIRNSTRFCTAI